MEEKTVSKRECYLKKEDMFMLSAIVSALRSKDPNTQVGAVIVSTSGRILSSGYNGLPNGCSDDVFPWNRSSDKGEIDTKYPYVVHAEANAIMNFKGDFSQLENCTLYTTLYPCHECAKLIIQSGIKNICYLSDKYKDTDDHKEADTMFDAVGINRYKFEHFSIPLNELMNMIRNFFVGV